MHIRNGDVVCCQSHRIKKARLLTRCFRSSVFCGRKELFLFFLTFTIIYIHRNTEGEEKEKNWVNLAISNFYINLVKKSLQYSEKTKIEHLQFLDNRTHHLLKSMESF